MYLTQMGEIPLLTRQREVMLAKQIERMCRKFRTKLGYLYILRLISFSLLLGVIKYLILVFLSLLLNILIIPIQ
ncbi:MAG: hypothetical protein IKT12_04460, partial [Thermoguttaceae bacterium]|nr:hypothetical protein [Thermoguttaceae bacterium]